MKIRDYCFWTCLTFSSLVLGSWLRHPAHVADGPLTPLAHRPATTIERATYWLALLRLAHGAPQMVPPNHQELPDDVVNAPAERVMGPDGEQLIAHGRGW